MSGVKGRSGKSLSPEAREAKRLGGMLARRGRPLTRAEDGTPIIPSPAPPERPRGASTLPPPPSEEDRLSDDPEIRIGKPFTWPDELKKEQVKGEQLANAKRAIEIQKAEVELEKSKDERDIARGKLLSRESHRASVAAVVASIVTALDTLPGIAAELVPPEQRPMAMHRMQQAIAKLRAEIAEKVKG